MRGDLNFCIVMLEDLGLSLPTPFPWWSSPCVAELGGWVLWRREATEPDQGFVRCWTWREGILVLVFKINKDVMSFFFPNYCSMCDWISLYDHMMMLVKLLFHIYLIIISLYVVIFIWGRYNSFCMSLGARGVRGARRGLKGCLDQPFFVKVWTILISDIACIYLQNYMHLSFNPSTLMAS